MVMAAWVMVANPCHLLAKNSVDLKENYQGMN